VETLNEAARINRSVSGNDNPTLAATLAFLSDALRHSGRFKEAQEVAREALAMDTKRLGPEHPRTTEAAGAVGRALETESGGEGDLGEVAREIAEMYEGPRRPEKAREWRAKLAARTVK